MYLLHAYRCTGPEGFGADLPVGSTVRRKRGIRLGVTLRDALVDRAGGALGEGWPLRIFEVEVAQPDIVDTDAGILRARAFSVAREIPLADAFGPRVAEVAAVLAGLPGVRWLRPAGAPLAEPRIADLVAEHQRALSDYQSVAALPLRIERTWRNAIRLIKDRETYIRSRCECPAVLAVTQARVGTTVEGALRVAVAQACAAAHGGAWDAAWDAGGRSELAGITAEPLFAVAQATDRRAVARAMETVSVAHAAAREPARVAARRTLVLEVFTPSSADMPLGNEIFAGATSAALAAVARLPRPHLDARNAYGVSMLTTRDEMVTGFCTSVTIVGLTLAVMAARHAGWHVAHLILGPAERDPWRPLLDVWRLGAWPIGALGGAFVVYVPEAQS